MTDKAVYKAINAVQSELARDGISKDRRNSQQGYSFRGIDDVYNALAPVLSRNKLCVLPRILSRECTERQTQKGGTLFYVVVEAEFDLVSAEDGSTHTIRTFGEAMDSADKATNKAMSAAYKYAAMQAFAIPTEGDNDADAVTHDVAPAAAPKLNDAAFAYMASFRTYLENVDDEAAIRETWKREGSKRQNCGLTEAQVADLVDAVKQRIAAIHASLSEAAE